MSYIRRLYDVLEFKNDVKRHTKITKRKNQDPKEKWKVCATAMVSTNRKKPESRTHKRICRFECDLPLVLLRKISNSFQANVPLLYPLKTSENQGYIPYFQNTFS